MQVSIKEENILSLASHYLADVASNVLLCIYTYDQVIVTYGLESNYRHNCGIIFFQELSFQYQD